MNKIDLHVHTTASEDGEFSPDKIFALAKEQVISALAFTDHDSVSSVLRGKELGYRTGIHFIPGIEITTSCLRTDIHILAYFIDPNSDVIQSIVSNAYQARLSQAEGRVAKLRQLGFAVDFDDVLNLAGDLAPASGTIFKVLRAREENYQNEKFLRYIDGDRAESPVLNFYLDFFMSGKPAHSPLKTTPAPDIISAMRGIGAVPILAHPGRTGRYLVDELLKTGLAGIEVYCSSHSPEQTVFYKRYATEHGLLITAGSDFHGPQTKPQVKLGCAVRDAREIIGHLELAANMPAST